MTLIIVDSILGAGEEFVANIQIHWEFPGSYWEYEKAVIQNHIMSYV